MEIQRTEDAYTFFNNCVGKENELFDDLEELEFPEIDINSCVHLLQTLVKENWSNILQEQPKEVQRNSKFQYMLTVALENVLADKLCTKITPILYDEFKCLDLFLFKKCVKLSNLNITPDQLGVPEEFVVPLPAAIVEFASLDTYKTPIDKIHCLETTYELILAELKSAIVNALAEYNEDFELPEITNEIVIALIMFVIVKSKPIHLLSNFYFTDHFQNTLSPSTAARSILNAFRIAVTKLEQLNIEKLNQRSGKIYPNLELHDVIVLTNEITDRFDKNGNRTKNPITPYDLHLEKLMSQISHATLGSSF